jgi:hypothetical protein
MATAAPLSPYANIDFLRAPRREKLLPSAREMDRTVPPARITTPMARPSYDLFGVGLAGSPLSQIRETQNLELFRLFREVDGLSDSAILKLKSFIGCPKASCGDDATAADINDWLEKRLHVNRTQTGFALGFGTFIDAMLESGRSHCEILLTADQREVWGLQQLQTPTVFYRQSSDRVTVEVMQRQPGGQWTALNPLKMLNSSFDIRMDDPYGKSIFHGLPMTIETATSLMKAMGGLYSRFGSPSYHVHVVPPEGLSDTDGQIMGAYMSTLQGQWEEAMKSRAEGDIRDFFSSGGEGTQISAIGAAGEALPFGEPMRLLDERKLAKFGIPPFLFGLMWATTERMSAVQALLIERLIEWLRLAVTSEVTYLIDLRQRLVGGDREFNLCWPDVTLIDANETATAEKTQAEADKLVYEHQVKLWRDKFQNGYDVARACVPGMKGLDDEEIDSARAARGLGPIPTEPPEPEMPPAFGGGQGRPGEGPQPPQRPSAQRSLTYGDIGNGRGH